MALSVRTKALIAAATVGGMVTFAAAVVSLFHSPLADLNQAALFATLALVLGVTWVRPLVMYRDTESAGLQSEGINLDEGFFILVALLLPAGAGVLMFALATAVAQAMRRLPLAKSMYNWGQLVTSAGIALLVVHLVAPPTPRLTVAELGAAGAGALVFAVLNNAAIAAIVASVGSPWRGILDGIEIRLLVFGSCGAVAVVSALAISEYRWALPVAVLPLLILRQVLAGHFQARHDRARLLGLFNAALEANSSLGEGDVIATILQSARALLRCPNAAVSPVPEGPSELGAAMLVNGEPSWLVVSGRSHTEPFDGADKALLEALAAVGVGALTNGQNYREGRFQRERLAAITSSLGEGVCALDRGGRVTFMNPAAARMLGWEAPPESVTLRSHDDRSGEPATPAFLLEPAQKVVDSRETLRCDDGEFRRDDGTVLPVAFTASAIVDGDRVAGVVIVFRDISQRHEVETAIRVARDQAIEASRMKSRFLANMSHEIRTPMNGVLGMSKLLLETDVDETQRTYLTTIRDSGENLMVILNDILDFSKIEAGKLDLEDVEFDLGASLASVINAMAVPAHYRGLGLHLATDVDLPRFVRGDPVRLRQVLTNLVSNAIKFTEVGTVTVSARVPSPGQVRISVTDTGIGIDPAVRATVLDAFGQADSSTTRRYGGTGLGLAICCQLVAMMGGVLDFTSQPGLGSTFWFEVAFAEVAAPAEIADLSPPTWAEPRTFSAVTPTTRSSASGSTTRPASRASANGERVLVADDNAVNQLVATLRLEKMGYQVDVVSTGEEALSAVQQTRYRAVLMDCRMPVMDGYEATRRIRALEGPARGTFVIAMTSSAMVGDREECMVAGMDDYLSKPLDAELLASALERATVEQASASTAGRQLLATN